VTSISEPCTNSLNALPQRHIGEAGLRCDLARVLAEHHDRKEQRGVLASDREEPPVDGRRLRFPGQTDRDPQRRMSESGEL